MNSALSGEGVTDDLRETFDNLDHYKIKLNLEKCAFGVPSGQLLGYFISQRGIEANPKKIWAILAMEKPKNLKGVQQLAGHIAAEKIHQSHGLEGPTFLPAAAQSGEVRVDTRSR